MKNNKEYVDYFVAAENAAAMQMRILEHYNSLNAEDKGFIAEGLRLRFNDEPKLIDRFKVTKSMLKNLSAVVLFPSGGLSFGKVVNIEVVASGPCIQVNGNRYAYRFKLNYKDHLCDPIDNIAGPVVAA